MNSQNNAVNLLNNDPLAKELLQSNILVRMAYTGTDGFPRVVPLGFYWDGTQFYVCTATNAPKVRALETNPKVAMTIDTNTQPPHVLLVRGTARLEIVDGVSQMRLPWMLFSKRVVFVTDQGIICWETC